MLSRHRFRCYICLPNALLVRECGLHILPTIDYFSQKIALASIAHVSRVWIAGIPLMFFFFFFNVYFLSLLLQCKFANSTLLFLLRFSYFITPYDAQASSAFSALTILWIRPAFIDERNRCDAFRSTQYTTCIAFIRYMYLYQCCPNNLFGIVSKAQLVEVMDSARRSCRGREFGSLRDINIFQHIPA